MYWIDNININNDNHPTSDNNVRVGQSDVGDKIQTFNLIDNVWSTRRIALVQWQIWLISCVTTPCLNTHKHYLEHRCQSLQDLIPRVLSHLATGCGLALWHKALIADDVTVLKRFGRCKVRMYRSSWDFATLGLPVLDLSDIWSVCL